jgi:hypothetical protein
MVVSKKDQSVPENRGHAEPEPVARLDRAKLREIVAEIERDFPQVSRRTGLVLFDVDPYRLQAQWQIASEELRDALDLFPDAASHVSLQVRLLRTDAPQGQMPAAVFSPPSPRAGQEGTTLFDVEEAGAEYRAELGLTSEDGGWLLLARSNRIRPPRPVHQPTPMSVPGPVSPEPTGGRGGDGSGLGEGAAERAPAAPKAREQSASGPALPFDPRLADSGLHLPPVFPNPSRKAGWSPQSPFLRVTTELEQLGSGTESVPLPVFDWTREPAGERRDLSAPVRPQSPPAPAVGPAAAREPPSEGSHPSPVFPTYDPIRGVSGSGASSPRAWGRPRLELHAEILVYGTAEPGSIVRLFGRDLRVGPGGRFLVRQALDDAALPEMGLADSVTVASEGLETE